jgi:hypothetical protein
VCGLISAPTCTWLADSPRGARQTSHVFVVNPAYLAMLASDINDRPRKIHDWKKPSEIFAELVEANASTV